MEYRVRIWSAMQGPGVPLFYVAEAMAKRAATGFGTFPLHGPTLKNFRPEFVRLLWDAAMSGQLTVCDSKGRVASATELIETASASVAEVAGAASATSIIAENAVIYLFARQKHLIEWGETSGDVFLFVETPGTLVNSDLRNFTEAGFGEVIKAGYYISAGGGGELEPWRDDLYGTAPCATAPAQSSAATPAPVGADVRASDGVVLDKAGPAKPLQRSAAQDSAILCEIEKQGYDPLALPKNLPGRPGVKAAIRTALSQNSLFTGGTVFDKAWVRLTARADIAIQG